MKKTILITGGNGFLGSNLVTILINDFKIVVLESKESNLYNLSHHKNNIKIYRYERDDIETIFKNNNINYVIHVATNYGRNGSITFIYDTNLIMPLKILEKALVYKVECFINTDTVLEKFVSEYALSKNHFRECLYYYSNNIKAVNIQLEHFYGPGANENNFITSMIRRMLKNEPVIELTKGEQERDFVYYSDVLAAFKIIINKIQEFPQYLNLQVASGELTTIKKLVELIKELTNSNSLLKFGSIPYRNSEMMKSLSDNTEILRLGWKPKINLSTGLTKVIEFEKSSFTNQNENISSISL